jgi:septal ring factor EnvC (AmiA/AmiB activator)
MIKLIKPIMAVLVVAVAMMMASCSSSPSEEQMKQLNDLKAEVSSLEKQITDLRSNKAALEKLIAEKNGKLQQCQADQEAVKKGPGQ